MSSSSQSDTSAGGSIGGASRPRLVWCTEQAHKAGNSLRPVLARMAEQLGFDLLPVKRAARLVSMSEGKPLGAYVLLCDWREAKPSVRYIDQDCVVAPLLFICLPEAGNSMSHARDWFADVLLVRPPFPMAIAGGVDDVRALLGAHFPHHAMLTPALVAPPASVVGLPLQSPPPKPVFFPETMFEEEEDEDPLPPRPIG